MCTEISVIKDQRQVNDTNHKPAKTTTWLMVVVMMVALGGCGNKGDLYLPEKDNTENHESKE